jgi:hypothetical protein
MTRRKTISKQLPSTIPPPLVIAVFVWQPPDVHFQRKGVECARYTIASVFRADPLIKSRESGRAGAEKGCVQGFQLSIAHN